MHDAREGLPPKGSIHDALIGSERSLSPQLLQVSSKVCPSSVAALEDGKRIGADHKYLTPAFERFRFSNWGLGPKSGQVDGVPVHLVQRMKPGLRPEEDSLHSWPL